MQASYHAELTWNRQFQIEIAITAKKNTCLFMQYGYHENVEYFSGRNINNFQIVDDTVISMAESEEEL